VGCPEFQIIRDGKPVIELQSRWSITGHPNAEDPLYVGGSSNRNFIQGGDWHEDPQDNTTTGSHQTP
jgi:hypothetical protein